MNLDIPKVMGILNVTPDSFYPESRATSKDFVRKNVSQMLEQGVDIIDVGGCSTRPGFTPPTEDVELERVILGCETVRELAPDIALSIDTFRSGVARMAFENFGANIINDVSGGTDPEMWSVIKDYNGCYVLTHNSEIPEDKDSTALIINWLSHRVNELHRMGINDVIIDPGFGFGKNIDQNFSIFGELEEIAGMGLPLLVGISRKSMIYKTLDCGPEESLNGTIALDALALMKGADILRVHDVKAAVETVKLFVKLKQTQL